MQTINVRELRNTIPHLRATSEVTPNCSTPGGASLFAVKLRRASETLPRIRFACRMNWCPVWVMESPRRWRSNSRTPRSPSSSLIASVTADWLIDRLCAAPDTVPSSATAIKYWSCRRVNAIGGVNSERAALGSGVVFGERPLTRPPLRSATLSPKGRGEPQTPCRRPSPTRQPPHAPHDEIAVAPAPMSR